MMKAKIWKTDLRTISATDSNHSDKSRTMEKFRNTQGNKNDKTSKINEYQHDIDQMKNQPNKKSSFSEKQKYAGVTNNLIHV